MRCTLQDIVRESGYANATVSRALNGSKQVSERARMKILETAQRLGYIQEKKTVAVIVSHLDAYYYSKLFSEISMVLYFSGYSCIVVEAKQIDSLRGLSISGAIAVLDKESFKTVEDWDGNFGVPLVLVNMYSRHIDGSYSIFSNEEQGMSMIMRHLITLGHRRIAVLGWKTLCDSEKAEKNPRIGLFRKIMRNYGFSDDLLIPYGGSPEERMDVLRMLLDRKVTAAVSLMEQNTSKIIFYLTQLGVKVPDDFSVCGWLMEDDAFYLPPVTGVIQNYSHMAKHALILLNKLMHCEPVTHDVIVDYTFFPRRSTARARH